jgi:hypothetical protein
MSDEETVQQVITNHAHLRDDLLMEEYGEAYTEDARQTGSGAMSSTGRAAILRTQTTYVDRAHTYKHFPGSSVVSVDGNETQAATDFIMVRLTEDKGIEIMHAGRYNDTLVRGESGRWQFQVREIQRLDDGTPHSGRYLPNGRPRFPFKPNPDPE